MVKQNKIIAYARTSTGKQDLGIQVQLNAFKPFHPNHIYYEKISGRLENRPELLKALRTLRKNDTLLIYKLDRLGRSTQQLVRIMNRLNARGIHLHSITDNINTTTPNGRCFFTIMSAIAELESDMISQRTKDALRQTDKSLGRPRIAKEIIDKVLEMHLTGNYRNIDIAEYCGISISSVYNILRQHR